ncbi:MAG: nitrous oxide reductase family maturation protein NosD [Methanosarcinales archaeon]
MAIIKNKWYAFAAIALALIMMSMGSATAKVINVDCTGGGDYTSIQSAINSASNGDTIQVAPCIYRENVVVDKSVSLIGADRDTTIIEGGGSGDVVYVKANKVNISGVMIKNSSILGKYAGIRILSDKVTIDNCIILSNMRGIISLYANPTISNCIISNNIDGIYSTHSSPIIKNNTLVSNRDEGILCEYSYPTIINNTISNNLNGIYCVYSYPKIINNIISKNNRDGIYLYNSSYISVKGNTISSNTRNGIYLQYSNNNLIYHNNIINNTNQALDSGNNSWDNGEVDGGNYWSNWKVKGNPSNGSQPYYISLNGIDHYPFQDPNGWNPKIKIYTDEESYTTGDTMNLGLKVTNPVDAQKVHAKIFLTGPKNYSLIDHKVNLPAGLKDSISM